MKNGDRLLLVEDNRDDEALTIRALKKHNPAIEIDVARDGVEALDYLFGTGPFEGRDLASALTLVLLDLKLPRINGLEVLQRMKSDERTKRIPVIVLTSSIEEADLFDAYGYGANSFFRKPVDFEQFSEAIRVLSLYWLSLNERLERI